MIYGELIEKYLDGSMDAAERLVFEHELEDNVRLRSEWEAWMLSGTMIQVVAKDSVPADLGYGFGAGRNKSQWIMGISAIALVLVALLLLWDIRKVDSAEESEPQTQVREIHIADVAPTVQYEEEVVTEVEVTPTQGKSISAHIPSNTLVSSSRKKETIHLLETGVAGVLPMDFHPIIMTYEMPITATQQDMVILDRQLDEGANLTLTAKKGIVLKPGFHVKAGTSFEARVEN